MGQISMEIMRLPGSVLSGNQQASLRACGVLSRGGWSPASKTGAKQMSRKDAHAFAASLAATLMVSIVVFQAGDGTFGAVPADEIDGDEVQVIAEVDPWA